MLEFAFYIVAIIAVFAACKQGPRWLRAAWAHWQDRRAICARPERRYFAAELPVAYTEGEEAMAKAWTALAPFLAREALELNYDAVGNADGSVSVSVVIGCAPHIERRVKDTIRRSFGGQATFVRVERDMFDELHELLLHQQQHGGGPELQAAGA